MSNREIVEQHFRDRDVKVFMFPGTQKMEFPTLQHFHDFMSKERDFWRECNSSKAGQISSNFNRIVTAVDRAINENNDDQAVRLIDEAVNLASQNRFPCFYSVNPIANLILEKCKENDRHADAMFDFLLIDNLAPQNKQNLEGYLYAFFATKFDAAMSQKLGALEKSLSDLHGRFTDAISTSHKEYLVRGEESLQKEAEIDNSFNQFREKIIGWKNTIQDSADSLLKEKGQDLEDLKKLYNEQLRLKEPAEYWQILAEEYKKKGELWRNWFVCATALFLLFLVSVLYNLPAEIFGDNALSWAGVKATLILAFMASVGVYAIHFFAKMSLSAYHMSRDAKERHQLTHIYLSLMHEGAINVNERVIVLQSIFSRVDTGLIKGESGPTLPDGLIRGTIKNTTQ